MLLFFITNGCSLVTNFWFICDFDKYSYNTDNEDGDIRIFHNEVKNVISIFDYNKDIFLLKSEIFIDNKLEKENLFNKNIKKLNSFYDNILERGCLISMRYSKKMKYKKTCDHL